MREFVFDNRDARLYITRMPASVMLLGLGDLGSIILELLARNRDVGRIIVASRDASRGRARVNLARLGAVAQGYDPDLHFTELDLHDRAQVVETIRVNNPRVIIHTATMLSWWVPNLLPPPERARIKSAGFGVWLPVHLNLTRKLMEAVRGAGFDGHVLSAPYPDVVNCVLGRLDLAPTAGIGNLDEIVPKIRLLAAERLDVPLATVQVSLVAHHALERFVFGEGDGECPPYLLRVEHEGRDVTDEVDGDELLRRPMPLTPGRPTHFLTAGSACRLILALLAAHETRLHAPGPHGLAGGYPVHAGPDGIRVALPDDWSEAGAIQLNERSHRFDGIERIEPDGTVVFTAGADDALRKTLGYECSSLPPDDAEPRAAELLERFRTYAARHGVDLTAIAQAPWPIRR